MLIWNCNTRRLFQAAISCQFHDPSRHWMYVLVANVNSEKNRKRSPLRAQSNL